MFKRKYSFEQRLFKSTQLHEKYPQHCPVICENIFHSKTSVKTKYLVSLDVTFSEFIYTVRKKLNLSKNTALFFFINNSIIPPLNSLFSTLYDSYKESDGFLYITYAGENTFGALKDTE